jgi:hypothetical protein
LSQVKKQNKKQYKIAEIVSPEKMDEKLAILTQNAFLHKITKNYRSIEP